MSYKNSYDRSIPIQICEQLAQAGNYEVEFVDVQNMWEGYTALYSSQCQAAVLDSRFSSGLTSTFPIFYDKAIVIQTDTRGQKFSSLLWQYLILLLISWLPIVIMSAHILYFLEFPLFPLSSYPKSILSSIYSTITLQNLSTFSTRLYSLLSCIFLFFILVFIISDLASTMSSMSISTGDLEDKEVCMTKTSYDMWGYLYVNKYLEATEECIDSVIEGDYDITVLGKLELAHMLYSDNDSKYENYCIYSETPHESQFVLVFSEDNSEEISLYEMNLNIKTLWERGDIHSIIDEYTHIIDIPSSYKHSFIFNSTRIVLVGVTLIVFFVITIIFTTGVMILCRTKQKKRIQEREVALSARGLLKSRNQTLSLERSNHLDQQGYGRPENEWINKAVAVDDEHAQRIKNIQDYENELSAVVPVIPSLVSSESLLSILKLENKK